MCRVVRSTAQDRWVGKDYAEIIDESTSDVGIQERLNMYISLAIEMRAYCTLSRLDIENKCNELIN